MKISLGSLLLFFSLIAADEFSWKLHTIAKEAYVNEAVALIYSCTFHKDAELYSIEMNVSEEGEGYRLYKLSESDKEEGGEHTYFYKFVLFPNQSGIFEMVPNAMMLKTNRESIENTILGRDNVNEVFFSLKKRIDLPAVTIYVKETNVSLTGDFTQTFTLDKTEVHAFEPLHIRYSIDGTGNMQDIQPLTLDIKGVKVFTEAAQKNYFLTEKGFAGSFVQLFTLVPQKSFDLKSIPFQYFNIHQNKTVLQQTKAYRVEVTQPIATRDALLDTPEETKPFSVPWCSLSTLLAFLIGFVVAKTVRIKKLEKRGKSTLDEKIKEVGSEKTLLLLLASSKEHDFDAVIEALESKKLSLREAKKEVLERIKRAH